MKSERDAFGFFDKILDHGDGNKGTTGDFSNRIHICVFLNSRGFILGITTNIWLVSVASYVSFVLS